VYCKKAVAFLESNRIAFQQHDVDKDPDAAARMRMLGGTGGVPFAVINGAAIVGFSARAYQQALGLPR
jgi:glutaredoxin